MVGQWVEYGPYIYGGRGAVPTYMGGKNAVRRWPGVAVYVGGMQRWYVTTIGAGVGD
jgi:hypothetical protein